MERKDDKIRAYLIWDLHRHKITHLNAPIAVLQTDDEPIEVTQLPEPDPDLPHTIFSPEQPSPWEEISDQQEPSIPDPINPIPTPEPDPNPYPTIVRPKQPASWEAI